MIQAEYRPFVRAVYRLYVNGLFSSVYPTVPYQDVVNVL